MSRHFWAGKLLRELPNPPTTIFFTKPIFEVSSERLKWMEQHIFLSHGHFHVENGTQSVEYDVYKVLSA